MSSTYIFADNIANWDCFQVTFHNDVEGGPNTRTLYNPTRNIIARGAYTIFVDDQ